MEEKKLYWMPMLIHTPRTHLYSCIQDEQYMHVLHTPEVWFLSCGLPNIKENARHVHPELQCGMLHI